MPVRPAKIIGKVFVCIVLSYIATTYYYFVFKFWGPKVKGIQKKYLHKIIESMTAQTILVVFHFLVFMLLWSFFQAMLTDPGQVPVFWVSKVRSASLSYHRSLCLKV